jgi:hypothetical protein
MDLLNLHNIEAQENHQVLIQHVLHHLNIKVQKDHQV